MCFFSLDGLQSLIISRCSALIGVNASHIALSTIQSLVHFQTSPFSPKQPLHRPSCIHITTIIFLLVAEGLCGRLCAGVCRSAACRCTARAGLPPNRHAARHSGSSAEVGGRQRSVCGATRCCTRRRRRQKNASRWLVRGLGGEDLMNVK